MNRRAFLTALAAAVALPRLIPAQKPVVGPTPVTYTKGLDWYIRGNVWDVGPPLNEKRLAEYVNHVGPRWW